MNRALSRSIFTVCKWWRSRQEAPSIIGIQDRIAEARRAHRKQPLDELKRERHARIAQQLGKPTGRFQRGMM